METEHIALGSNGPLAMVKSLPVSEPLLLVLCVQAPEVLELVNRKQAS